MSKGRAMKKKEFKFALRLILDKFYAAYQECDDLMPVNAEKQKHLEVKKDSLGLPYIAKKEDLLTLGGFTAYEVSDGFTALQPIQDVLEELEVYLGKL
jgi:hypothetical protein